MTRRPTTDPGLGALQMCVGALILAVIFLAIVGLWPIEPAAPAWW